MGVRAPAVPSYGENFPVFKAQIEKKKKKKREAKRVKKKKKVKRVCSGTAKKRTQS